MHSTHSVGQAASDGSDILQAELAHWTAVEAEAVREYQARQGGSTGAALIAAPAAAVGPAPARKEGQLAWPPGIAGSIANLIYTSSMRPVPEVAIVSALGLLAGVCGRSWVIPKSGLNVYIVLLARSGIGKEAMSEGISMFIHGAGKYRQDVEAHFSFNEYASGQALTKAVANAPCFTHIAGEFGRKLKAMSNGKDPAMQSLRSVMTKIYSKSGPNAIAGGIDYSNKDNNVASIVGASYSMIGDSTPGTFREALTSDMMEDGFLSRFTVVEYTGQRPPRNPHYFTELPDAWAQWFASLTAHAQLLASNGKPLPVQFDEPATELFDQFDQECDAEVNSTDDESRRQMWNRAQLKSLRIAALLAVADNHVHPCVNVEHAQWAIDLIRHDIALFSERLRSGDIGEGSDVCERKLLSIMKEYLVEEPSKGYKIHPSMRANSIIPRAYLQRRTASLPAFQKHRSGSATAALDHALRSLADSGYTTEVKKDVLVEQYSEFGKAFLILKLPQ
ncbi:TPA: DUF3987 domain-containing protein [Pseudomonas aeruginosa]